MGPQGKTSAGIILFIFGAVIAGQAATANAHGWEAAFTIVWLAGIYWTVVGIREWRRVRRGSPSPTPPPPAL